MSQFNPRELSLVPSKKEEGSQDQGVDSDFIIESVDQIVYNQLNAVESELIDRKLLLDIYNGLNN